MIFKHFLNNFIITNFRENSKPIPNLSEIFPLFLCRKNHLLLKLTTLVDYKFDNQKGLTATQGYPNFGGNILEEIKKRVLKRAEI